MHSIVSTQKTKLHALLVQSGVKGTVTSKLRSHRSFQTSNIFMILISCILFGFNFSCAKSINSDRKIENHYYIQSYDHNKMRQQCFIGFQTKRQGENLNSLFVSYTIKEKKYQEFNKEQLLSQWKYCVIKQSIQGQNGQIKFYSDDWKICREKCCATISQDQCYFKASSHQQSIFQFNNPKLSLRNLQSLNNNQVYQPKDGSNIVQNQGLAHDQTVTNLVKQTNNTNGDQTSTGGPQIVMIVLLCIFGVPFALLMFFAILSIIKLCRSSPRPIIQAVENPNHTQNIIIEEINLDEYKMDEMGPYHINFQQQCPICLDYVVNIRTHCGHYYHPQCLKAWLMRGKNRCPVCNCTRLNPMKVYCKKCSVGIKLVVLHGLTDEQIVSQLINLICEDCVEDKNSAFSPTPRKSPIAVVKRRGNEKISSCKGESVGEGHNQNQIQSLGIRSSSNQLRSNAG